MGFRRGSLGGVLLFESMIASGTSNELSVSALSTPPAASYTFLRGSNFSGRSALISRFCEERRHQGKLAIFISQEIDPTTGANVGFSYLTHTVVDELTLHTDHRDDFEQLVSSFRLGPFMARNLSSLSGGEQAMLGIACKLGLNPHSLCLDGALEQLDPANLVAALCNLTELGRRNGTRDVVITHNWSLPEISPARVLTVDAKRYEVVQSQSPVPKLNADALNAVVCQRPTELKIEELQFTYPGEKPLFDSLSVELKPGRIYRLAGPNGAGKSTLAKILNGYYRPSKGRILVNGKLEDLYAAPGRVARLHFQSPDIQLFARTVHEEISTLRPDMGKAAIRFGDLDSMLRTDPFDLPFVMRKRVALCTIACSGAPWLIFDEPTIGQDDDARSAIAKVLRTLVQGGHGVIIITHNDQFAAGLTDETISLPLKK